MKVLLAVPTYNRVGVLADLVEQFRKQVCDYDLTLLIVNDGDCKLTSSDPRIVVENLPERRCVGDKRFFAYNYAKENGFDFILDVDDDDYYYPEYTQRMVDGLIAYGAPFACLHYKHWMMRIDFHVVSMLIGFPLNVIHAMVITDLRRCGDNHFYHDMEMAYPLDPGSLLYRRDLYKVPHNNYVLDMPDVGIIYVFTHGLRALPDAGYDGLDISTYKAAPNVKSRYKYRNNKDPFRDQEAKQ